MQPNQPALQVTPAFEPTTFPATRFIADVDEKGTIILDKRTREIASGKLVVEIFQKVDKHGGSRMLARVEEPMTFQKYKVVREEIDTLGVTQLAEYFPALGDQLNPKPVENVPVAKPKAPAEEPKTAPTVKE